MWRCIDFIGLSIRHIVRFSRHIYSCRRVRFSEVHMCRMDVRAIPYDDIFCSALQGPGGCFFFSHYAFASHGLFGFGDSCIHFPSNTWISCPRIYLSATSDTLTSTTHISPGSTSMISAHAEFISSVEDSETGTWTPFSCGLSADVFSMDCDDVEMLAIILGVFWSLLGWRIYHSGTR